jgi:hypothetical protein
MRTAICPLRDDIGENESALGELMLSASGPIFAYQFLLNGTMVGLVKSCMERVRKIRAGELNWQFG